MTPVRSCRDEAHRAVDVMTSRIISLSLDANDPKCLGRFWAAALGWEVEDATAEEIALVPDDRTSFEFLVVPNTEPKFGQNRIHLDLTTTSIDDRNVLVENLISLGAEHANIGQRPEESHIVLADPEGNEFCIIEPTNDFLSTCPRLGAINCDGTQAVGYFWSEALRWPLVWDHDEETAIRSPNLTGPMITWSGPPLMPKLAKNRLHLDIAPPAGETQNDEVNRLIGLGASRIDIGQGDVSWVVMADPDGNEFCVLTPR